MRPSREVLTYEAQPVTDPCTQTRELVMSGLLRESDDAGLVEELQPSACNWDCETVLSNYSNIDNHPGLLLEPNGRC